MKKARPIRADGIDFYHEKLDGYFIPIGDGKKRGFIPRDIADSYSGPITDLGQIYLQNARWLAESTYGKAPWEMTKLETAVAALHGAALRDRDRSKEVHSRAALGGRRRHALAPNTATIVKEIAFKERKRRMKPWMNASEAARSIEPLVNDALENAEAGPVSVRTIRRHIPPAVVAPKKLTGEAK